MYVIFFSGGENILFVSMKCCTLVFFPTGKITRLSMLIPEENIDCHVQSKICCTFEIVVAPPQVRISFSLCTVLDFSMNLEDCLYICNSHLDACSGKLIEKHKTCSIDVSWTDIVLAICRAMAALKSSNANQSMPMTMNGGSHPRSR